MRRRSLVLALLALTACSAASPAQPAGTRPPASTLPIVYAAVGASESVGYGADDRFRQAWPQLFYNIALPSSAVFYNFGIPGELTGNALSDELPRALAERPTLVTVWLNVDDLREGVSPQDYESQLRQLVHALRQGGRARVLVANTPYLDRLPAYLRCQSGSAFTAACELPFPAQVNALVDQYNAAIARVVAEEGAILVDLHSAGEVPDLHPTWVSVDGFHPSAEGHLAVAEKFVAALRAAGRP
jgi:lysophospholipase L1-like esterase